MNRVVKAIVIICFLSLPTLANASANYYYVTQNGAGFRDGKSIRNAWSVADFNNPQNWSSLDDIDKIDPGDTVYFSGKFTDKIVPAGSGIGGKYITLDGYEKNNTTNVVGGDDTSSFANSSANIGFLIRGDRDYLIIQDFKFTGGTGIMVHPYSNYASGSPDYLIMRRNHFYQTSSIALQLNDGYKTGLYIKDPTIGGSPSNGNLFEDCGVFSGLKDRQPLTIGRTEGAIISYNKAGNSSSNPSLSQNIITIHDAKNTLVEFNEFYGARGDAAIAPKEAYTGFIDNLIIRYNKIHDNLGSTNGSGINISGTGGNRNIFVYGNLIYNNTFGIIAHRGASNVYIWSNIIYDNLKYGVGFLYDTKPMQDFYLYKNVIANNAEDYIGGGLVISKGAFESGICTVRNNIFYNNNRKSYHRQAYVLDVANVTLDYNQYYCDEKEPIIRWGGIDMNISQLQSAGFEINGSVADPRFTELDAKGDMSKLLATVNIQGTEYLIYMDNTRYNLDMSDDDPSNWIVSTTNSTSALTQKQALKAPSGLRINN